MRAPIIGIFEYAIFYLSCTIWDVTSLTGVKVETAKENEFPFIVSISSKPTHLKPAKQHICGGTLFTKKHVLTAAHCINDKKLTDIRVISGLSSNNQADLRFFDAIRSEKFEEWAKMYDYLQSPLDDIGVLELNIEDTGVTPAILQILPDSCKPGSTLVVTGWGRKMDDSSYLIMKKASLPMLENLNCRNHVNSFLAYWERVEIPEQYVCTPGYPVGLGECGDSGSPVLDKNNFVVGVHIAVCPLATKTDAGRVNMALGVYWYQGFIADVSYEQ